MAGHSLISSTDSSRSLHDRVAIYPRHTSRLNSMADPPSVRHSNQESTISREALLQGLIGRDMSILRALGGSRLSHRDVTQEQSQFRGISSAVR